MTSPRLHFNLDDDSESGFVADVDRETTTDGQVVRELLQNALDAGAQGGGPVRVVLAREMVSKADIPLMGDYEQAFERAKRTRSGKETQTGRNIIKRAEATLRENRIPVLVCADNGRGLLPDEVAGLYGRGASEVKRTSGRGSIGLGHLRAFAPSMLRYLLYASRHTLKQGRTETFAGQAILATSSDGGDQFSANGYVVEEPGRKGQVRISNTKGASTMPPLMRRWASWGGGDTGTVVAICGYRPLRANGGNGKISDDDLREVLFTAAAKNFAVAIHEGQFVVEWRSPDGAREVLDKDSLKSRLEVLTRKTRSNHEKGPADLTAKLIGDTLRSKQRVEWSDGGDVKVWWQRLEMGDTTRVCLHRDGMFITHDCPLLERRDFASRVPFLAVVDVRGDHEGSLAALVREAEGESHLRVQPSEIEEKKDRDALKRLLSELGDFLRGLVPELKATRFEPEELRLGGEDEAQLHQRPRIKEDFKTDDENDDATPDDDGDDDGNGGNGDGDGDGDDTDIKPRKVRRGVSPEGLQITTISMLDDDVRLRVAWKVPMPFPTEDAGLRVCIRSGADETSQRGWDRNTEYLEIEEIKVLNGCKSATTPRDGGEKGHDGIEWRLCKMQAKGDLEIVLTESPPDADVRALAVELVQRDPITAAPKKNRQADSSTAQKVVAST